MAFAGRLFGFHRSAVHGDVRLRHTLFGLKGDPHFDVFHIASYVFIIGGFWILSAAWDVLHTAQKQHKLATAGIYAKIRHPHYVGFITIMIGFLLQWPTILTLAMSPVLVIMYVRLARSEEREMRVAFGAEYEEYVARTPAFIPHLAGSGSSSHVHG